MKNIVIPKYVRKALVTLQSRGHLAYLVGGCVRDMLLQRQPNDWDICTSALPEEVMEVFPSSRPTGLQHGTVTIRINSRSLEVTTFRSEGSYTDHRRPDVVSFVGDLNMDLSRRDFTMNAIALPADGLMVDPFHGVEDIRAGLVRCVGEPERRFEEDALRMFRALRFAARLGFDIEEKTMAAIGTKASLAAHLAAERVRDEIEKMLMTPSPQIVHTAVTLGLMDAFLLHNKVDEDSFAAISQLHKKTLERWCALSMILLDAGAISSVEGFLTALRLDNRTIRCCEHAREILRGVEPASALEWKRLLNRCGVDAVQCAAACGDALYGGRRRKAVKAVLKSGDCFSVKHLAIGGDELLELGFRGRALGEMLNFLLDYVMEYPENNRRELLLSLAAHWED